MNKNFKNKKAQTGISLIEVMLAVSLLGLMAFMFANAFIYTSQKSAGSLDRKTAMYLAEEGINVVTNLRDENFNNLIPGEYGLTINGSLWELSGDPDETNIFTRTITINDSGIDTKLITSKVEWGDSEVELEARLTNWRN